MSAYPIRPKPDNDKRFTFGLITNVGGVLAEHGFPAIAEDGDDHVRLGLALYRFICGDPE